MTRTITLIFLIIAPFVGSNATTTNETSGGTANAAQTCNFFAKIAARDTTAIRKMIDANCALEVKNSQNMTPLVAAVTSSRYNTSIVWLLTQAGANANVGYFNSPLLNYAAGWGMTETSRLLIEGGADVDGRAWGKPEYELGTALHVAAWSGYVDTVQMLIDKKATVNLLDKRSQSPLHYTSELGNAETARALIKAGANLNAVDSEGKTPLHRAIKDRVSEIWIYIGGITSTPTDPDQKGRAKFVDNRIKDLMAVAKVLVESGAKLDIKDKITITQNEYSDFSDDVRTANNWTPLHYAALNNRTGIIRILADAGALLNPKDVNGNTPLHVASKNGNVDAIRALFEAGVDDRVKNTAGLRANKVAKDATIKAMVENPGIHWPLKAYAVGNASTENADPTMRILCDDSKDCRVYLNCFDENGKEFHGWIGDLEKRRDKTTIGSITKKSTLSLSSSELKTLVDAANDTKALDCALHSPRRITVQVWSIASSGKTNMTAYRMSENDDTHEEASVRFYYGDSSTPYVHFRCLAGKGERCSTTKFECVDDDAVSRPTISAGIVQRLHLYTVAGSDSTSATTTTSAKASAGSNTDAADHRIPSTAKGWHSCKVSSSNPFMVYVTDSITKGNSSFTGNSTAISME